MDKLLTLEQVCAITTAHKSTLRRWMRAGTFPQPLQIGPRRIVWRESDIREWLNGLRPVD